MIPVSITLALLTAGKRIDASWLEGQTLGASASASATPKQFPKNFVTLQAPRKELQPGAGWGRVTHEFVAEHADELSLDVDDVVYVLLRINAEWLKGVCCGIIGIFPASFVEMEAWFEAPIMAKTKISEDVNTSPPTTQASNFPSTEITTAPPKPAPPKTTKPLKSVSKAKDSNSITAKPKPPKPPVKPRQTPGVQSKAVAPSPNQEDSNSCNSAPAKGKPPPKPPLMRKSSTGSIGPTPAPRRSSTDSTGSATVPKPPKPARPVAKKKSITVDETSVLSKAKRSGKEPMKPARRASVSHKLGAVPKNVALRPQSQAIGDTAISVPSNVDEDLEVKIDQLEKVLETKAEQALGFVALIESCTCAAERAGFEDKLDNAQQSIELLEEELIHMYSKRDHRAKVVAEIFDTEFDLSTDLTMCLKGYCGQNSPLRKVLSSADFDKLFCNIDELAVLSNNLAELIRYESLAPPLQQKLGVVFCEHAPTLKGSYVKYVVNFDDANELLIELCKDTAVKEAMAACQKKVENKTKSWDLANFLIKPVQRVLKYPLLLKELRKRTAADHPDLPKIVEAESLLTDIATAINEGRRTKELLEKYTDAKRVRNPHGVIHSITKKGIRVNQRLRARGSSRTDNMEYAVFNAHTKEFFELEVACKRLRKRCEEYLTSTSASTLALREYFIAAYELLLSKEVSANTMIDADKVARTRQVIDAFKRLETCRHTFVDAVKPCGTSIDRLLTCFVNPSKLIAKRADKKLDYERYRRKILAAAKDQERQRALQPEFELAENTFRALDRQLTQDLPEFLTASRAMLHALLKALVCAEHSYITACSVVCNNALRESKVVSMMSRSQLVKAHRAALQSTVQSLVDSQAMLPLRALCKDFGGLIPQRSGSVLQGRRSTEQRTELGEAATNAMIDSKSYQFGNGVVKWRFDATSPAEVSISEGESVLILSRSDNLGNDEWWKVRLQDKSEGYVPASFISDEVTEPETFDAEHIATLIANLDVLGTAAVLWDFDGDSDIELTVTKGSTYDVLRLEDLTGNSEWVLLRSNDGDCGFVPTSFVTLNLKDS